MAGLCSRLACGGHQVTLVTLDDASGDRHSVDARVERLPLDVMRESRSLLQRVQNTRARVDALRKAVDKIGPDVILSFCDRTNILVLTALAASNVPIVISERSDPSQQKLGRLWELRRRQTYPKATSIIAQTDGAARALQPLHRDPIVVIPSAVATPPQEFGVEDERQKTIVGVGRLEHEKGFDRLIRAFAMVADDASDWRLKILGEGSRRGELEELARDYDIDHRVSMPGWVKPIWPELFQAGIFALPSRYEGFPSALMEAMATGAPAIAVDCDSGPRCIVEDDYNGLLVENDTEALGLGIERLIRDIDLRQRLGRNAVGVTEMFGWNAMVRAYERVLNAAVEQNDP